MVDSGFASFVEAVPVVLLMPSIFTAEADFVGPPSSPLLFADASSSPQSFNGAVSFSSVESKMG